MGNKESRAVDDCCAGSETMDTRKGVVEKSSIDGPDGVSALGTPEESVRRGVARGLLTREEGELLLLLLAGRNLIDLSVGSVLSSLIMEIAEETGVQKREDRVYVLREFVSTTMPTEDAAGMLSRTFRLR